MEGSRITTSFNAVDVEEFHRATSAVRNERIVQGQQAGHAFLFVGQLIPRKNVDSLIRAFALMRNPTDRLTVVGDGSEREALHTLAAGLGVSGHVEFTGTLGGAELIARYAAANTLVLPSITEVWGLVVNEALASGLQVVVTNRCGVSLDIADWPAVTVCEPSVNGLAAAMKNSAIEWTGPDPHPSILKYGPDSLASTFTEVVRSA